jgi:hypothetical protein
MNTMKAFGKASSITIAGLVFETDEDRLVISGAAEVRRDVKGLAALERMADVLQSAIDALKATDLPEVATPDRPDGPRIDNPFA